MKSVPAVNTLRSLVHRAFTVRGAILFAFHAFVFAGSYALAWLLRFEFEVPPEWVHTFLMSAPVVIGIQLALGAPFGFYRGWWRYVGVSDVVRVGLGLSAACAVQTVLWYAGPAAGVPAVFVKVPRGVLVIDWAFAILILFAARIVVRMGQDRMRTTAVPQVARAVLIVGAGDAGEALAREIQHRPQLGMKVVGFVDDQRSKWNSEIRGITVTGPISNTRAIADALNAQEALIAIPSASGKRLREIIHHLSSAGLPFKTIPGLDQLVSGRVRVTQLRPVNVEDLLRRESITLAGDHVRRLFKGKRIVVTGAGGTIGSELSSQVAQFGPERLVLLERSEYALYEAHKRLQREGLTATTDVAACLLDIRDEASLEAMLAREKPDVVLHAAAHKHVPLGEENPAEYLRNNAFAARSLAELCAKHRVERFVFISTDKAINPSSVMGATKRAAEILLLDLARTAAMKMTIVRFGNVIGSSGSVVPLFMEQIAAGGPVTVTDPDVTRYFIRTSEAISLVLQAAALGNAGEVFMLDMGEPVKVVDLARDLIRLSNHTEDEIPIIFTGLRPGEKMFEEIRMDGESVRTTAHPQIVVTEAPQPDADHVRWWMTVYEHASSPETVGAALRSLVPEYEKPFDLRSQEVEPKRTEIPIEDRREPARPMAIA